MLPIPQFETKRNADTMSSRGDFMHFNFVSFGDDSSMEWLVNSTVDVRLPGPKVKGGLLMTLVLCHYMKIKYLCQV